MSPPDERAAEIIRAYNGGRTPDSFEEWQLVARRADWRLRLLPQAILPAPVSFPRFRVAWIPNTKDHVRLMRWCAHEVAEAFLYWDGEEPFIVQSTHHEVARQAEALLCAAEPSGPSSWQTSANGTCPQSLVPIWRVEPSLSPSTVCREQRRPYAVASTNSIPTSEA
jgi:hypothetical protein